MPYQWLPTDNRHSRLHLWPHRSLTQAGFVWFVGLTAALIAVPLLAILGSPVLWALLPFLGAAVWGIWFALRKNGRDRDIVEDLVLAPGQMTLTRHGPRGQRQDWQANPHWVRVDCLATEGRCRTTWCCAAARARWNWAPSCPRTSVLALQRDLAARLAALR